MILPTDDRPRRGYPLCLFEARKALRGVVGAFGDPADSDWRVSLVFGYNGSTCARDRLRDPIRPLRGIYKSAPRWRKSADDGSKTGWPYCTGREAWYLSVHGIKLKKTRTRAHRANYTASRLTAGCFKLEPSWGKRKKGRKYPEHIVWVPCVCVCVCASGQATVTCCVRAWRVESTLSDTAIYTGARVQLRANRGALVETAVASRAPRCHLARSLDGGRVLDPRCPAKAAGGGWFRSRESEASIR